MADDELLRRVLAKLEDHERRILAIEKAIRDANDQAREWLEKQERQARQGVLDGIACRNRESTAELEAMDAELRAILERRE